MATDPVTKYPWLKQSMEAMRLQPLSEEYRRRLMFGDWASEKETEVKPILSDQLHPDIKMLAHYCEMDPEDWGAMAALADRMQELQDERWQAVYWAWEHRARPTSQKHGFGEEYGWHWGGDTGFDFKKDIWWPTSPWGEWISCFDRLLVMLRKNNLLTSDQLSS